MKTKYDVIVIGAGSMGMSTGYHLSKEDKKVLLIDAYDPPHESGSHTGDTRLIRHAYGEGIEYVPLALRAQELWDELQAETSDVLFRKNGVLTFGVPDSEFVLTAIESGKKYNIEMEIFENGNEINERWEGFNLPEDYIGVYEPNAGTLHAGHIIARYRELALENGVELKVNEPVIDLDVTDTSVAVTTTAGEYTADKIVVSAGAYNNKLFNLLDLDIRLEPTRRTVGWYASDENLYKTDTFPGFFGEVPGGAYYGFPSIDESGVKIGDYYDGVIAEPEYINRQFGSNQNDEKSTRNFLETYMPESAGKLHRGAVCVFTNTPDEHFIIDFHPQHDNVVIAGGFSGHGFKFSSVVGEILSQLVTRGETEHDISLFSITRPVLQKPTTPASDTLTV